MRVIEAVITKIKRVIIVGNNNDINLTFKLVLSQSDQKIRVHTFNDCVVALQEFRPNFYDLIIIDVETPKINGFEFHDIVRKLDCKVKICFLTTTDNDIIKKVYPKAETFSILKIPITNEELINQTYEILEF